MLYTEPVNSTARRARQTVMYELLDSLVKLLAPIIPHTADEVWKYIPGREVVSVQLTDFPDPNLTFVNEGEWKKNLINLWT